MIGFQQLQVVVAHDGDAGQPLEQRQGFVRLRTRENRVSQEHRCIGVALLLKDRRQGFGVPVYVGYDQNFHARNAHNAR